MATLVYLEYRVSSNKNKTARTVPRLNSIFFFNSTSDNIVIRITQLVHWLKTPKKMCDPIFVLRGCENW
jgi:hypothetical protein